MPAGARPTKLELEAARQKRVPDLVAPNLTILFCGINPGLYSAAVGHHFARPGNRFWPALFNAGFTLRLLWPHEEGELLKWGYGITNIAGRATAAADELTAEELERGAKQLRAKVLKHKPRYLAVLGVGAYRAGFGEKDAKLGLQPRRMGETNVWVLPNPSGLNAHYRLDGLADMFRELRAAIERDGPAHAR